MSFDDKEEFNKQFAETMEAVIQIIIAKSAVDGKDFNKDGLNFFKFMIHGPEGEKYMMQMVHIEGPKIGLRHLIIETDAQ